jgi:hypothetical protein
MMCKSQSLTDLELVTKIKEFPLDDPRTEPYRVTLFYRYEKLAYKMASKLAARARGVDTEDYLGGAYEMFLAAVASIDLSRITRSNWSFWLVYWGYLNSYNRNVALAEHKIKDNEIAMFEGVEEGGDAIPADIRASRNKYRSSEDEYINGMTQQIFWTALDNCFINRFNDIQKSIFELRGFTGIEDAKSNAEVMRRLNITQNVFNREIRESRRILREELDRLGETSKFGLVW